MAKIVYGSLAGAISGALGNQVFSHNRFGAYVRTRVIPTKSATAYTDTAHGTLVQASQYWGSLTAGQQAAWRTWAQTNPITDSLGQKQVLDGHAACVQLNARIIRAAGTMIAVPPAIAAPPGLPSLSVSADDGGAVVMTFGGFPVQGTLGLWTLCCAVNSPGVRYVRNLFKLVTVASGDGGAGIAIGTSVVARFGSLVLNQRVFVRVAVVDIITGLLSASQEASCVVVAGP